MNGRVYANLLEGKSMFANEPLKIHLLVRVIVLKPIQLEDILQNPNSFLQHISQQWSNDPIPILNTPLFLRGQRIGSIHSTMVGYHLVGTLGFPLGSIMREKGLLTINPQTWEYLSIYLSTYLPLSISLSSLYLSIISLSLSISISLPI